MTSKSQNELDLTVAPLFLLQYSHIWGEAQNMTILAVMSLIFYKYLRQVRADLGLRSGWYRFVVRRGPLGPDG